MEENSVLFGVTEDEEGVKELEPIDSRPFPPQPVGREGDSQKRE